MNKQDLQPRYFVTYTGIELPLKLLNEIDNTSLHNRITYFIGYFNEKEQLMRIEKSVYGEIELTHQYEYDENHKIIKAVISEVDEDPRVMVFDQDGQMREIE